MDTKHSGLTRSMTQQDNQERIEAVVCILDLDVVLQISKLSFKKIYTCTGISAQLRL